MISATRNRSLRRAIAALALIAASLPAFAAPVAAPTAVHVKPDATTAAITVLSIGTEPVPAANAPALAPSGWMAVELAGPHTAWLNNKDLLKSLDVNPGASYRLEPKADAPVLSLGVKGDPIEIIGLRGKWTQVRLSRPVIGYIQVSGAASAPAAVVSKPAAPAPAAAPAAGTPTAAKPSTPAAPAPIAAAPVAPAARGVSTAGQAAPMVNLGDGGSSALPRLFQGKITSTRNPLRPRRPFDYQILDDAGERYAYLDLSKLLATSTIENYLDRTVVVYGTAKPVPGTKDMVIEAESLQLR